MQWLALSALALGLAATAHAATVTDQFQVTATVVASCTVSATDLGFGNYDPLSGSHTTATSTVTVRCSLEAPFDIGLDAGTGSGATITVRRMTLAADTETLDYGLFSNATHTTNWGDTVGVDTVSGTGTGLDATFSVYGRLPAGQNQPVGSYSDTITVTVTY